VPRPRRLAAATLERMTDKQMSQQQTRNGTGRWAPWWVYVVVLVPANAIKQYALGDAPVAVNVAATLALVAVGVVGITALYRTTRGAGR
jgi:hypothetical protein